MFYSSKMSAVLARASQLKEGVVSKTSEVVARTSRLKASVFCVIDDFRRRNFVDALICRFGRRGPRIQYALFLEMLEGEVLKEYRPRLVWLPGKRTELGFSPVLHKGTGGPLFCKTQKSAERLARLVDECEVEWYWMLVHVVRHNGQYGFLMARGENDALHALQRIFFPREVKALCADGCAGLHLP